MSKVKTYEHTNIKRVARDDIPKRKPETVARLAERHAIGLLDALIALYPKEARQRVRMLDVSE